MKTIPSFVFRIMLCVAEIVTLSSCAPASSTAPSLIGTVEPPDCLEEAIIHLTANPAHVLYGETSVLRWSVELPPQCGIVSVVRLNNKTVAESGSQTVQPTRHPAQYSLFVGVTYRGIQVSMAPVSTQITVDYPAEVLIDQNTVDPAGVLIGALKSSTKTIELCNVEIDLTGEKELPIDEGESLIAKEECARSANNLGPRIFVTDKRDNKALFLIHADHATVSGFRLEGPTSDIGTGDSAERGIIIKMLAEPSHQQGPLFSDRPIKIVISNMEIFHWSGLGVQVSDNSELAERGRLLKTNIGAVHIFDNYFHHNRHGDGQGYGVAVKDGAYALIEHNVFDENRHAIAGESRNDPDFDYSGYTARENLILAGGGLHCWDYAGTGALAGAGGGALIGGLIGGALGGPFGAAVGAIAGAALGAGAGAIAGSWCRFTHQIDMHGDQNQFPFGHDLLCGTAGESMLIQRNTILYTRGHAINIRGNPLDLVLIDDNVFADNSGHATNQNGTCELFGGDITNPILVRSNNEFNSKSYGHYGVCDFDGDGIDDLFYPTGRTWWYSSFGEFHWTYLNARDETLEQVRLGYFDDDLICDVLIESGRDWVFSSGGTGEWQRLDAFGAPLYQVRFGQFDPHVRDHRPGATRRTTHAFWRMPDGQWQVTALSAVDWQPVASSSFPLNDLQFGDFTGDGVTDVLAVENGSWAISESARGAWQSLNEYLDDDVSSLFIADLNNNNIDDVIKVQVRGLTFIWWVSDDGRTRWRELTRYTFPAENNYRLPVFAFAGRFGTAPGGGVLLIDPFRLGHFYSEAEIPAGASPDWTSLFPY